MLLIDKHKLKQKCNNFGYLSTQFWLKGNDRVKLPNIIFTQTCLQIKWIQRSTIKHKIYLKSVLNFAIFCIFLKVETVLNLILMIIYYRLDTLQQICIGITLLFYCVFLSKDPFASEYFLLSMIYFSQKLYFFHYLTRAFSFLERNQSVV